MGIQDAANIAQLAIEARAKAVELLVSELQAHEDLARIPQLRARLERKLGDTQQWLSSTVYSQVQEMKEGLDLITAMGTTLADLHATFRRIEELCGESSELMDEHERLELLSVTRENLQKLQADVQGILSIPFEAAAVEAALEVRPMDLMPAFWAVARLEGACAARRAELDGPSSTLSPAEKQTLVAYFRQVEALSRKMQQSLTEPFRDVLRLSVKEPQRLIAAVRVVEVQERARVLVGAAGRGDGAEALAGPEAYAAAGQMESFWYLVCQGMRAWVQQRMGVAIDMCQKYCKKVLAEAESSKPPPPVTPDPKQKRAAAKASAKKEKDKGSTASAPAAPVVEDQVVVVGGGPGEGDASTPSTAPAPAPPEPEQDPVLALLDAMDEGCGDLIAVFDNVTLCFPPERNVFKVLWGFFHEAFSECIGSLCHVAGFTSNSDILAVLGWSIDYYSRMAALGLEDEETDFLRVPGVGGGIQHMIEQYTGRLEASVLKWTKNIVAADINPEMNSIEEMPDGRLYTKGPTDVFRILHEQLPLAAKIKMPLLHSRVAMALLRCVAAFQTMEREVVASGKAHFELLCALANNCFRCYDLTDTFMEAMARQLAAFEAAGDDLDLDDLGGGGALTTSATGRLDRRMVAAEVDRIKEGFAKAARDAASLLPGMVLGDPGTQGVLDQLCRTADPWLTGETIAVLDKTVRDYLEDLQRFLEPPLYSSTIEELANAVAGTYFDLVLLRVPEISEPVVERMQQDEGVLREMFESMGAKKKAVEKALRRLRSLQSLVSCSSVEDCNFWYSSILKAPETSWVTPSAIDKLLATRKGLSKGDLKEISQSLHALFKQLREAGELRQDTSQHATATGRPTPGDRKAAHRKTNTILGLFGGKRE